MKIVLVEWAGYPLRRQKVVAGHIVKCGLARILKSIDSCKAGAQFTVVIVVNCVDVVSDSVIRRMRRYAELKMKYSFIESLHFRGNEGLDIGAKALFLNHQMIISDRACGIQYFPQHD